MKKGLLPSKLFLSFLLVFIFGCEKLHDLPHRDNLTVNGCRLEKVHFGSGSALRTGTFSYNAQGQPVSLVFDADCATSVPNVYQFRYDEKNRLTDFIEGCDNNSYEAWHVYKYNNRNQIVKDSVYIWGELNGGHPSETDLLDPFYYNYTYDNQGRMTEAAAYRDGYDENISYTYSYNSDGNVLIKRGDGYLPRPGAVYDNEVNINRTNKIWMFLNRDYSQNNFTPATSYNEKGLPLNFANNVTPFNFLPVHEEEAAASFEYNCENNHS